MIKVICMIQFAVNAGGLPFITQQPVRGVVKETNSKFLVVDFSKDIKRFNTVEDISDFKSKIVSREACDSVSK